MNEVITHKKIYCVHFYTGMLSPNECVKLQYTLNIFQSFSFDITLISVNG